MREDRLTFHGPPHSRGLGIVMLVVLLATADLMKQVSEKNEKAPPSTYFDTISAVALGVVVVAPLLIFLGFSPTRIVVDGPRRRITQVFVGLWSRSMLEASEVKEVCVVANSVVAQTHDGRQVPILTENDSAKLGVTCRKIRRLLGLESPQADASARPSSRVPGRLQPTTTDTSLLRVLNGAEGVDIYAPVKGRGPGGVSIRFFGSMLFAGVAVLFLMYGALIYVEQSTAYAWVEARGPVLVGLLLALCAKLLFPDRRRQEELHMRISGDILYMGPSAAIPLADILDIDAVPDTSTEVSAQSSRLSIGTADELLEYPQLTYPVALQVRSEICRAVVRMEQPKAIAADV